MHCSLYNAMLMCTLLTRTSLQPKDVFNYFIFQCWWYQGRWLPSTQHQPWRRAHVQLWWLWEVLEKQGKEDDSAVLLRPCLNMQISHINHYLLFPSIYIPKNLQCCYTSLQTAAEKPQLPLQEMSASASSEVRRVNVNPIL